MREWTFRHDGVRLAVREYGVDSDPPAVVAHGVGSTAEFVARCWAEPLAAAGLRLVAYDLRGHGDSTPLPDPSDQSLDAHAADLAALARATGATVAGGVSLGAHAAARAAAGGAPLDRLLVALPGWLRGADSGSEGGADSGSDGGSDTAAANRATAAALAERGVAALIAQAEADPGALRWVVAELRASWPRHDPRSLAAAFAAVADDAPDRAELARVSTPVGIAAMTDDPAHPLAAAHAWADALPAAAVRAGTMTAWGTRRSLVGELALSAWNAAVSGSR